MFEKSLTNNFEEKRSECQIRLSGVSCVPDNKSNLLLVSKLRATEKEVECSRKLKLRNKIEVVILFDEYDKLFLLRSVKEPHKSD